MNLGKNTTGGFPTPLEITCSSLSLGEDEQKELGERYALCDNNPEIILLRNRVAISYHGRSIKILQQNASNFREALESL